MAALTLKYIQDNPEVTDAGYSLSEEMSRFVDEAAEANYTTDDGNPVFYCASERTANCIANQANSQDMRKAVGIRYVGKAALA